MTKIDSIANTNSTYVDSTLSDLSTYTYCVVAKSLVSPIQSTFLTVTPPDSQAPTTPTHFLARGSAANTINLVWRTVIGTTSYVIERSTDGVSGWQTIATANSNAGGAYANSGLVAGQTYYYRITSKNAIGSSLTSTVVSATAPASGFITHWGT